MTHFQRMIAIPQEEYLTMTSVQNARQPLTQRFYNLENRYNEDENIKDPYRRLIMQSETLEEMKSLKDQMRNYLSVSVPKPYQNRAQALFRNLESFLRFNDKGEIFDKDNNVIDNSRVEDLIQHAVRDRRRNMTPTGWNQFVGLLQEHNIPKSILNRQTLDEMENRAIPKKTYVAIKKEKEEGDVKNVKQRQSRSKTRRQPSPTKTRRQPPQRQAKPKPDFLSHFKL